jgi:restriction system protein
LLSIQKLQPESIVEIVAAGWSSIATAMQLKRRITTHIESVIEVRNFVGAMVLAGSDQGIFVTTASHFSKVARDIPAKALLAKYG